MTMMHKLDFVNVFTGETCEDVGNLAGGEDEEQQ